MRRAPRKQYTGAPDILFDVWLPVLEDCELRTILVIVRKTIGWRVNDEELSLNVIAKLAGISKSSVVRATNSLIERGLIGRRKNTGDDSEGQTQSTYWLRFDDETDDTPEPPTAQGLSHPRLTPEPPVTQPPEPPTAQVIGIDPNTFLQTLTISEKNPAASQEYKTPADKLPKIFLSRYNHKPGAKLDPQRHDKAKVKIWLSAREEDPDEILAAQECFFDDQFWAEAGWPFSALVAQFQKYLDKAREKAKEAAQGAPQRAAEAKRAVPQPGVEPEAVGSVTAKIELPDRWNQLVPAMPVSWDWNRSNVAGLRLLELDDVFVSNFDDMCRRAQKIHEARTESKYLTFNWLIKRAARGESANWFKLLQDFGWMETPDAKSKAAGPWKPGMLAPKTDEHEADLARWREGRRAAGKHTDPDRAFEEGDTE